MRRRLLVLAALPLMPKCLFAQQRCATGAGDADRGYAAVIPGYRLRFPHDEGSHPAFRTEWWYITGWLSPADRPPLGFQVTFFRTRPEVVAGNPSAFSPRQIVIAHAALSEAARGRLVHDQTVARAVFGLAGADEGRTHVWIDEWSLTQKDTSYAVRIPAREFALELNLSAPQPPLLQGDDGYSRKGPQPESASYYYSVPHLAVAGVLVEKGRRYGVSGNAWLDHEWSSSYMDERASGWDWIGINLADGGALMAFRMRDRSGGTLWAGGAYRSATGLRRAFSPDEVAFTPVRSWRSPRTGASYPVAFRVKAGDLEIGIDALMDDQEHDTRATVGTVYWEGAVTARIAGKIAGRGYLELTGYWRAMKL
jgi:predicted secreted hydrolase